MEDLASEASRLLNASLSGSTWNSYNRAIENFNRFRATYDLGLQWPAHETAIVSYIAYLSIEGWAHSTICLHLAAIAFYHKINSWPDPTDSFIIKKLREGSRRSNRSFDDRRPITFELLKRLQQVLPSVCKSNFEATLFRAAFLLAYFGFLRVGEYACASQKCDGSHVLSVQDISFDQACMYVRIRFSKTDQRGNSTLIRIEEMGDTVDLSMCPVRALRQYLAIRPKTAGLPLFLHFDSEVLTKHQVNRVLKLCVSVLGLATQDFSPHSFRIGAATSAAMQGVQEEAIKRMGRWRSNSVRTYIRPSRLVSLI